MKLDRDKLDRFNRVVLIGIRNDEMESNILFDGDASEFKGQLLSEDEMAVKKKVRSRAQYENYLIEELEDCQTHEQIKIYENGVEIGGGKILNTLRIIAGKLGFRIDAYENTRSAGRRIINKIKERK